MFRADITTYKNYLKMCKSFNVEPVEDAKALIEKYAHKPPKKEPYISPVKQEALDYYYEMCKTFNKTPVDTIKKRMAGEIYNCGFLIVDNAIKEKYGKTVDEIEDAVAKGFFVACITGLYDQKIYNISEEDIRAFTKCERDKLAYLQVYVKCGGEKTLFPLFSPFYDLDEGWDIDPYGKEYEEEAEYEKQNLYEDEEEI